MHDPQDMSPQYLEDLATGYWRSEALFTAVERGLFTKLEPGGKKVADLAEELGYDLASLTRFLQALDAFGLVFMAGGFCGNTKLARKFLVEGAEVYQGDSILWRKYLVENWESLDQCLVTGTRVLFQPADEPEAAVKERFRRYCRAMDAVARTKIEEILPVFAGVRFGGDILDVGSGLGAFSLGFLRQFPGVKATLLDMEQVIELAGQPNARSELSGRISYIPANVLEPWLLPQKYSLIILSNIIHAFSEAESVHVLSEAIAHLADDGLLLIHDFFTEHNPEKASLSDLNMLVNTYNGKVYSAEWVKTQLAKTGLASTGLVPLTSDTGIIVAARRPERLTELRLDPIQRLSMKILELGFDTVGPIEVSSIHVPEWVGAKCQFGCASYGSPQCPPDCIKPEKTRAMLGDFSKCLLIQGTPPTRDFQSKVLQAERLAFKAGYYKAFAMWAGPCNVCVECSGEERCINPKNSRPSMEASGIDVFETARRAGFSLKTLPEKDDHVKYFALLLLE